MNPDNDARRAATLDRLRKKRTVVRASTTKVVNEIFNLFTTDPLQSGELEERLALLSLKEISLKKINEEIEELVDIDSLEEEVASCEVYEEKISVAKTKANRTLKTIQKSSNTSTSGATGLSDGDISVTTEARPARLTVKLPRLEITRFRGDFRSWQSFWGQFETTIHQNETLSNIDKFKYLKSYLMDRAAMAIEGLSVTEQNYNIAVDLLKDRFGRKELIIDDHMEHLLAIRPVHDSANVAGLRSMYDQIQTGVRSLEALGVLQCTYGVLLLSVLKKSVPTDLCMEYNRKRTGGGLSRESDELREFLNFMKNEVESRERALHGTRRTDGLHGTSRAPRRAEDRNRKSSAAVLTSTSHTKEEECAFCESSSHVTPDCRSSKTMEERQTILKRDNRCFRCTKRNHRSRDCRSVRWLNCATCSGKHATAMCDPKLRKQKGSDVSQAVCTQEKPVASDSSVLQSSLKVTQARKTDGLGQVMLQTARSWTEGHDKRLLTRMLLDGGSQRTFIRKEISERLGLRVLGDETLSIYTFGGNTTVDQQKCRRVELWLRSQYSRAEIRIEALEVPEICADVMAAPPDVVVKELVEKGMIIADASPEEERCERGISLLIGADNYWDVVTGTIKRISGLVAVETIFGWTLQGPTGSKSSSILSSSTTGVMRVTVSNEGVNGELSTQLRSFWELEHIGISHNEQPKKGDEEILRHFEATVLHENGRYQVSLPWNEKAQCLQDNKGVAYKRLRSLTTRLSKNEHLMREYDTTIREYLKKGFAEEADDTVPHKHPVYYMPHQAVVRQESTTTRLRVVFDASSSAAGCLSLNDALSGGPNLNPDLTDLLIKFRMHRVAIVADIEKAFLQVALSQEDRDALRFLWYETTPESGKDLPAVVTWKMTRVPFGATSSPFLLAATLRHHLKRLQDEYPVTTGILRDHLYVDDLVTGADSTNEAILICDEAEGILEGAGMHLRKWKSNERQLIDHLKQKDGDHDDKFTMLETTKVLGVNWDPKDDILRYDMTSLIEFLANRENTKRYVLRSSARIFDPLGFLSPVVTTVKIMFQTLWERGLDWDDALPPDICSDWEKWCIELPSLKAICVPRLMMRRSQYEGKEVTLHVFCDASPKAYGAVVYVTSESPAGEVGVALVMAKSRVAPLKRLSLPRLELMGTLVGARLAHHLRPLLHLEEAPIYLWTDSMVALHWIKSSANRWKPFVANRVSEIQTLTDPSEWRHCPGKENPADQLTRGIFPSALMENRVWWSGPLWLQEPQNCWPGKAEKITSVDGCKDEEKRIAMLGVTTQTEMDPILNLERYSSYTRAVRVTACIYRFLNNCRSPESKRTGPLTAEEVIGAELYWQTTSQRQAFGSDIVNLRNAAPLEKNSAVRNLSPYLDEDGVLRVGGRLQLSDNNERVKHPIILASDHPFTTLLIEKEHRRLLHAGTRDTLAQLRESYWILRGRQAVKKLLRRCITCRRQKSRPASEPTAPLPADRITRSDPFDVIGVDFAGPLMSNDGGGVRKCYIAVFTCAVTRAVHLELVSDLSARAFLLAFKRFVGRRGISRTVYSDNALTFKRASKDLQNMFRAIRSEEVQGYFSNRRIIWKYIVERAAWWGGFWERLVRSVKVSLRKVLGKNSLNFEELATVLIEAEAVINSRPLTFVYTDVGEPEPLSPAHFLVGQKLTSLPPHRLPTEPSSSGGQLRRRWNYRNSLIESFWRRWRNEYLLELRSAHITGSTVSSELKPGDLVLLKEDRLPRHMWKMCRVSETFPGRDGKVRACEIVTTDGGRLKRAIQALYPLEL